MVAVLTIKGGGSPHNIKFSGLICVQVKVGTHRYLPLGGSFTLSDKPLWVMPSPVVEGFRDESGAL